MNYIIYQAFGVLLNIIDWVILIRILLSWIPLNMNNPFVKLVYALSEPLLYPIRQILRKSPLGEGMMIDFSPIILILILQVLQRILYSVLIA